VIVQSTVTAATVSSFGIIPLIEVKIGLKAPHVGGRSNTHSRVVFVKVAESMEQGDFANSIVLI
jgi:hypothetical protein